MDYGKLNEFYFVLVWKKYDRDTGDKYVYVLVSSYNVDLCMGFIKHWAILSPVTLCYWQEILLAILGPKSLYLGSENWQTYVS